MKLKYTEKTGVDRDIFNRPGHGTNRYAHAGTEVKIVGNARWAETSMGSNKVVAEMPNGDRIVIEKFMLTD